MQSSKSSSVLFTIVCLFIGFIVAIQYQTHKHPTLPDTRNINELRITLQKERDRAELLTSEISKYDQLLYQYETSVNKEDSVKEIMEEELFRIKKLAGFHHMEGEGFIIEIKQLAEDEQIEHYFEPQIYDDDLRMIVNELNAYGAKAIAINGQRMIATSSIRNVGETILVNTIPIKPPYEIAVIGDSSILIPALRLAGLDEYFMVVNHSIEYKPKDKLLVPSYNQPVRPNYLQPVKEVN